MASSLLYFAYTALAAGVTTWAAHNPVWHDPALWFLGVLGHAIGFTHAKNGGSNGAAPGP